MSRKPVEWDYERVEALAGLGLGINQIAAALGCSESVIYKSKKKNIQLIQALKNGRAKGLVKVANALYQDAITGNTTAQIFYLKNRDPENWSDRQQLDALVAVELPTTLVINVTDTPRPMTKGCVIDQETDD
jgi:hypothetical protein